MKGKLLSVLSLFTIIGYGQLQTENFENNDNALPIGWQQINVNGPAIQWRMSHTGNPEEPPYEGDHAAYIAHENMPAGTTSEDWLITLQFLVPENGQLTFYSRLLHEEDQGSVYRIMITTGDPYNISTYTELRQWTELEINPVQLQYNEVIVPIPAAYAGHAVYIAFVMNGDFGDGWLVDAVGVQSGILDSSASEKISGLQLYPNPVKDMLNIAVTGTEVLSAEVFDCNGRQCSTILNKGSIDMSRLSGGLYFVKVTTPEGTGSYKVFKE